ncbi:uncharacterized protein LOC132702281 [Cylas formicarius]|uniref:uncharacterized protein LOC132702281 n=1 Tax=Cylas formicarius TaxID=197179 RepID=UPI002958AFE2|nr:uncharacterized protein LOC132702281 [Cylas formicarius]
MIRNDGVTSPRKLLEAAVKVRKLDLAQAAQFGKLTRNAGQRISNFEEFKKVYGPCANKQSTVQALNSKSCFKTLKANKDPKHVKFVEIEVPANLGAENAILPVGEDHGVRKKVAVEMVNREIVTDNLITENHTNADSSTRKQLNDVAVCVPSRKQKFPKSNTKTLKRKDKREKIATALSDINEKLEKILVVDDSSTKTKAAVKDESCTQSCNVEVLFQNRHYPDDLKIEDTLKEIEAHLDNIANLDVEGGDQKMRDEENIDIQKSMKVRSPLSFEYPRERATADIVLRNAREAKSNKLTAIRRQIATIEEFFDRIENLDKSDSESHNESTVQPQIEQSCPPTKEGLVSQTDLIQAIQKSSFLSKEFNLECKVKVFSDSEKNFLRERRGFLRRNGDRYRSQDSISKLIENVRVSLENTLYEPAS